MREGNKALYSDFEKGALAQECQGCALIHTYGSNLLLLGKHKLVLCMSQEWTETFTIFEH